MQQLSYGSKATRHYNLHHSQHTMLSPTFQETEDFAGTEALLRKEIEDAWKAQQGEDE